MMDLGNYLSPSAIGGLAVLVIIAIIVIIELCKHGNKKEAKAFIEGLVNEIEDIVLDSIGSARPQDYTSLADFESVLIENIYERVWEYVKAEVNKSENIDKLTKAAFNRINQDMVRDYIDKFFESRGIYDKMINSYGEYHIENDNSEEIDKELAAEYSDSSKYNEVVSDDDLEPAVAKEPTAEEKAALNPQRDEEEDYDANDSSQEVLPEKNIISIVDKAGRTRYYEVDEDGKRKAVSKAYAEQYL